MNKENRLPDPDPMTSDTLLPDRWMTVEVAYARPERQEVISVRVRPGSSIEDAIRASGILTIFSEIDLEKQTVGIFSQRKSLEDPVADDDRVEIYRDLIADPKEIRRRRAAEQKKQGVVR